ncbi:MAG: PilN domain-containing protein [Candidatus Komeilibacteria bacterium]|nr:PilN domain-containing protein [Candidatus Komeilibacteria bacterium]
MISLNLISPEQQHNLKLKYWQTLIKNCAGVLLLAAVVTAIWLIPLDQQINGQQLANEALKTAILASNSELTEKINVLNSEIGDLIKIKNQLYSWSATINELAGLAPAEIALLEFNGSASNGIFTLKGFAKTRDALIVFQNKLNGSSFFEEIDSPLENYLQKDEVTFQITGKLKR